MTHYTIDQLDSVRMYRDDAEFSGLDGRPLNWREELDRDEPEEREPEASMDPRAAAISHLAAWQRRKPGRSVHLGDGYVMLSEPGSAPVSWSCPRGELPAASIHCFCMAELFR